MAEQQTHDPSQDDLRSFMEKYGEWAQTLPATEQAVAASLITNAIQGGDVKGFSQGSRNLDFGSVSPSLIFLNQYQVQGFQTQERIYQGFQDFLVNALETPDFSG